MDKNPNIKKRISDRFAMFSTMAIVSGATKEQLDSMPESFPCFIDDFVESSKESNNELEDFMLILAAATTFATKDGYEQSLEACKAWERNLLRKVSNILAELA